MKISFSICQCLSRIAFAVGGSHSTSSGSLSSISRLHRSSTELWTAVPMDAGILAFRGSLCLESQYFRGQSSYLLQEDGDSWWATNPSSMSCPRVFHL